jgi:hypothetical protein
VIIESGRFRCLIDLEKAGYLDPLVDFVHMAETWFSYAPELVPPFRAGYGRVRPWQPDYDQRIHLYRCMQVLGRLEVAVNHRDSPACLQALTEIDQFLAGRAYFPLSGHGFWSRG